MHAVVSASTNIYKQREKKTNNLFDPELEPFET